MQPDCPIPFGNFPLAYSRPGAVLYSGDGIDLLRRWPSRTVDLVFVDPPYRLSNNGSSCQGGTWASVNKGKWDKAGTLQADHQWNLQWLQECQRILKPSGTLWCSGTQHNIFSVGFALQELGWHLLNTVVWFKPNASPNLSCRYFTHSTELLIWASPVKGSPLLHTFNYTSMRQENGGKQMRDVWEIPKVPPSEKKCGNHPTQKPLRLLRRVIAATTNPGDIVLDPFAGSCTTGVAALDLGRQFVGCETDRDFVVLGGKRLGAVNVYEPMEVVANT